YRLARAGAHVTIVDDSHPREKPCGGGVTGRALAVVQDAVDTSALQATRIRRARFTSSGADGVVDLDAGALVVTDRATFDAALVDAARRAGASLVSARLVDVATDASGARLTTRAGGRTGTLSADFVIGADGAAGLVRRRLSAPFTRDQISIATGFFARG